MHYVDSVCRSNLKIIGIEIVFFFFSYYIGSWSSEVVNRFYRVYLGRLPPEVIGIMVL